MEDKFEFDEKKHLYKLNGQAMTGVTTVLGVIAKPMLIQWAATEATKYVASKWMPDTIYRQSEIEEILDEAKVAHRKKKEEAGEKGTDIHAEVERLIKEAILRTSGQIEGYQGELEQIRHFVKWAKDNEVVFRGSEEKIYSKEWFMGGTCDFLCEIGGELWLGDIKTGSGIYPEHFFQCAAYQKMYEEMGLQKNFKGNLILNLRKDGTFEEKRSISNEDNLLAFQSALNLYRVQQKVKGTII